MLDADLDLLIPAPPPDPLLKPRWGTVTGTSPLMVRRDGEANPVKATSGVYGLAVNDRVWTVLTGKQLIAVVRAGGDPQPAPYVPPTDTGWLTVYTEAGYTANALAVRRVGDQVFWRGRISSTNFASIGNKLVVVGLDAQFRPTSYAFTRMLIDITTGSARAAFEVGTDGNCTVRVAVAGTGTPEAFINLSYWRD